jgi:hypothetical protein
MFETVKENLAEIISVSESCPEIYRVECFKLMLSKLLISDQTLPGAIVEERKGALDAAEAGPLKSQREVIDSDLHIKFRGFMKKSGITLEQINELFYFEDDFFQPLFDDLKTIKASEVQIRISLLQAMQNGMSNGSFEFDGESVRAECQKRKAYDMKNFATCYKTYSSLFDSFEGYKKEESISLSEKGKDELARIVGELIG